MSSKPKVKKRMSVVQDDEPDPKPHDASFSEEEGVMTVRDGRLFRRGQEAFCRRLIIAAARQDGVRSVLLSLESSTCRVEFAPGRPTASQMADRFAKAVKEAVDGSPNDGRGRPPRRPVGRPGGVPRRGRGVSLGGLPARPRTARGSVIPSSVAIRAWPAGSPRKYAASRGVLTCRVSPFRHDLRITYDPAPGADFAVVGRSEEVMRRILRPEPERPAAEESGSPAVATGLRRLYYLTMAGGSFTLTLVGLVVPGIPTVPFLLATSYYLVRSSPRLNRSLSRSWFFGPILTDLEKWGGLRPINKLKLVGLTLTIGAVTLVLIGPPLVLLLIASGGDLGEPLRDLADPRACRPAGRPRRGDCAGDILKLTSRRGLPMHCVPVDGYGSSS